MDDFEDGDFGRRQVEIRLRKVDSECMELNGWLMVGFELRMVDSDLRKQGLTLS